LNEEILPKNGHPHQFLLCDDCRDQHQDDIWEKDELVATGWLNRLEFPESAEVGS
jgi:hypothetical protein